MDHQQLHTELDHTLREVTHRITGNPDCPMRPGQVQLAHNVLDAMLGDPGQLAGVASTGIGKSVAYSIPAMLLAATRGDRTVISTEGKALQAQLIGKDLPLVADVVRARTGATVTSAIHKGFGNYGCPYGALTVASEVLTGQGKAGAPIPDHNQDGAEIAAETVARLGGLRGLPTELELDGRTYPTGALLPLVSWVLEQTASGGHADRSHFEGDAPERLWSQVSVTPDECLGPRCGMYNVCPAVAARQKAAAADVLVTNHTLLAIQATTGAPVVLSNKRLGQFDHLIVDEAHALPAVCRSTGARQIGAPRLAGLAKRLDELVGSFGTVHNPEGDKLVTTGHQLADRIESALSNYMLQTGTPVAPFDTDTCPLGGVADAVRRWGVEARGLLPDEDSVGVPRTLLKVRRLRSGLGQLGDDVADLVNPSLVYARWVEVVDRGSRVAPATVAHLSPVDVAPGIVGNLFSVVDPYGDGRLPVSVTMVSATLPQGFAREVGLWVRPVEYQSPFESAYESSLLFVPRVSGVDELGRVGRLRSSGRSWALDIGLHERWAAGLLVELVAANQGRALVLSAKADAGRLYADTLRAAGLGVTVFSQWDGLDARQVVDRWRDDMSSVLVGTRSLMTGVDAAGETCSLVVLDRVPRNPGNVVDDARSALLQGQGVDRWAADRATYAADAALLLEQAAGRLVRRVSDVGMVAVLDPRLMKGTPISYGESTRATYMGGLRRFVQRTGSLDVALGWLAERRRQVAA